MNTKTLASAVLFQFLAFCSAVQSQNLVDIVNGKLKNGASTFYPVSINYLIDIVQDGNGNICVSPHWAYGPSSVYEHNTKSQLQSQLESDFQYLASKGFNSVRIIGFAFQKINTLSTIPQINVAQANCLHCHTLHQITAPYTFMFSCIQQVLDAAELAGIKVQLLVGGPGIEDLTFSNTHFIPYLQALSSHFRYNTTLYSYDLVNEPSLFLNHAFQIQPNNIGPKFWRGLYKEEACQATSSWYNAIKNNSKHLVTIGLIPDQIHSWDPAFMHVDFLSYHIYPYTNWNQTNPVQTAIQRVKSYIKWCSLTSPLPWMLGETGFKASTIPMQDPQTMQFIQNDGSMTDQQSYAIQTLDMVRDCGGIGYSWWEFKDDYWTGGPLSLIDANNNPKPLLESAFMQFQANQNSNSCTFPPTFYNVDNTALPFITTMQISPSGSIKYAQVSAWSNGNCRTFSDQTGVFSLNSSGPVNDLRISGVGIEYRYYQTPPAIINTVVFDKFSSNLNANVFNLNDNSTNKTYQAVNSVNTQNYTISGASNINIKSENTINIKTTTISYGSNFRAYIGPFHPDCSIAHVETSESNERVSGDPIDFISDSLAYISSVSRQKASMDSKVPTSSDKSITTNSFLIHPNPAKSKIHIIYDINQFQNLEVLLYSIDGRLILKDYSITEIALDNLNNGIYILTVRSEAYTENFKIVIDK